MQKKMHSHDYYRKKIDKWIIKEAKLRLQLDRAIARQSSNAVSRISLKIKDAVDKQSEIMQDWCFFISFQQDQQGQELQCQQKQTKSTNA